MATTNSLQWKSPVHSKHNAAAIGPYSPAVQVEQTKATAMKTVYFSGQIGVSKDGTLVDEDCPLKQMEQAMTNLRNLVEAAGMTMGNIVKTTVLLAHIEDFAEVNRVYESFFSSSETPPARVCYAVRDLPMGALVEVDATGYQFSP